MKKFSFNKIFWGIALIVAAIVLLLDATGILTPFKSAVGEISLLSIVLAVIILYLIVRWAIRGQIGRLFIPLALLFMLFEPNIAYLMGRTDPAEADLISNWILLLCAVIFTVGFYLIFGKKSTEGARVIKGEKILGNNNEYIDCADFTGTKRIENNLGAYNVYFNNAEKYEGNGTLIIENNLGETKVYVPNTWKIDSNFYNSLGSVSTIGNDSPDGPVIYIRGENNLGSVQIIVSENDAEGYTDNNAADTDDD